MGDYTHVLIILIKKGYVDLTNTKHILELQSMNKQLYLQLFPVVNNLYHKFIEDNDIKKIKSMNNLALIIDQFKYNNNMLKSKMYQYIILCYENWSIISLNEYLKSNLLIPTTIFFKDFLAERNINMRDILPECKMSYTHYHHQSKTSSGFKQILFR